MNAEPQTLAPRSLADVALEHGQRWVYSAGFNITPSLKALERLDEEVEDLRRLADSGCRVALLSHQGGGPQAGSTELDYLLPALRRRLGDRVRYVPAALALKGAASIGDIPPGDIALVGNTRLWPGETDNGRMAARAFAAFGDYAAIGGFSKFHREHASNCGLLRYVPGVLTTGVTRQMKKLEPWAGKSSSLLSLAVLGGTKPEKLHVGLKGLLPVYDYVLPGGAVLNELLRRAGQQVGASAVHKIDWSGHPLSELLAHSADKLLLPEVVLVERAGGQVVPVRSDALALAAHERIVDFEISPAMRRVFQTMRRRGGRALLAGTPSLCLEGRTNASHEIVALLEARNVLSIVLGGDSVAELPYSGVTSAGGGSALSYIVEGSSPVLRALAQNERLWSQYEV